LGRQLAQIDRGIVAENIVSVPHDRLAKSPFCHGKFIKFNACATRAEIDIRFAHARNFAQGALVADRARTAMHPAN
jgi:hypothetical protein